MKKQFEINFGSKQLGKLPANLYTERERFILALWSSLFAEGAYQRDKNDNLVLQWSVQRVNDYIKSRYELSVSLLDKQKRIVNEKERNFPDRIQVAFKNQTTFTFDPNNLPALVESIGGKELLVKNEDGLTPYNPKLIAFLKVFVSKDVLRPGLKGAYFDVERSAVVATDGYRLILIEGKPTQQGVFSVDNQAKPIDEIFPRYYDVIPENNPSKVTLDAKELLRILEISIKGLKATQDKPVVFVRTAVNKLKVAAEDPDPDKSYESSQYIPAEFEGETMPTIGFNGKLLIENLKAFLKYSAAKSSKITLEIKAPDKPVVAHYTSVFGKTTLLTMPLRISDYEDNEEYKPNEQKSKPSSSNKALTLKIAVAKAKIAIALAVK